MKLETKSDRSSFYNSRAWKDKRNEILENSNYECSWCKVEGKVTTTHHAILEVDHIKELEDYPELALDNENLRVLCKSHHNMRHERFEYNPNNKKNKWQDEKW